MPDLYKGKIPIIYRDLNEGFIRAVSPDERFSAGCTERDFNVDPVEMRDSPAQMKLYEETDFDAIYDERQATQSGLEFVIMRAIERKEWFFLDQDGFPDCWQHSPYHAMMVNFLLQGLPMPKFNAVAAATLQGRTNGGWCGLGQKYARDVGGIIAGTGIGEWKYQSRQKPSNMEAVLAKAAQYRVLEEWYDLGHEVYDQTLTKRQLVTSVWNNNASPSDYPEYSHSMLTVDYVRIEKGLWGPLTLNSWDRFGYMGLCVLANRLPSNSCSLRAATATAA